MTARDSASRAPSAGSGTPFAYAPPDGGRDEVFGVDGVPHDRCQDWMSAIEALGVPEMERRWEQAKRLIRDNGVTYNVYGDPRGMEWKGCTGKLTTLL